MKELEKMITYYFNHDYAFLLKIVLLFKLSSTYHHIMLRQYITLLGIVFLWRFILSCRASSSLPFMTFDSLAILSAYIASASYNFLYRTLAKSIAASSVLLLL